MDLQSIRTALEKWVPFAILTTLLIDWIRLRSKRREEEKKQIAKIIPELLELRVKMMFARKIPKMIPEILAQIMPAELRAGISEQVYPEVAAKILPVMINKLLPDDGKFNERYRNVVDEIAGYRPLLAFRLRGKENNFDFKSMFPPDFPEVPGSLAFVNGMAGIIDDDMLADLEETILSIAKAHSFVLHFQVKRRFRRRIHGSDPDFKKVAEAFSDMAREFVKANSQPSAAMVATAKAERS